MEFIVHTSPIPHIKGLVNLRQNIPIVFQLLFSAHNAVVTCSVFAPVPQLVFDQLEQNANEVSANPNDDSRSEANVQGAVGGGISKFNSNASFKKQSSKDSSKTNPGPGYVIISGDYDGEIKVFLNAVKPKHSSLPT